MQMKTLSRASIRKKNAENEDRGAAVFLYETNHASAIEIIRVRYESRLLSRSEKSE